MKKGHWSETEDAVIIEFMQKNGSWADIVNALGGRRTTKQCRERWSNHLDPTLKKTKWSVDEDQFLIDAQARLGNCWTRIALEMPGRSENEVKNRWYSTVHKFSLSGKKRKVNEIGAAHSLSPRQHMEDCDDHHVNDCTEDEGDTSANTRYRSIENEIYRLCQDVNLFMEHGTLQLENSDMNLVYARMGYDYLQRRLMANTSSSEMQMDSRDSSSSKLTSVTTGVLTSSSSIGVDLDVLREINFSDVRDSERTSPGSFLVGFSISSSPTCFGPAPMQYPDPSTETIDKN